MTSAPPQTQEKSKLEEIVKSIEGKGVDMGALLQEALAKMKGIPLKSPQPPPAKRMKLNMPTKPVSSPSAASLISQLQGSQLPMAMAMPMPLPYTAAKMAPIPTVGNILQIKELAPVNAPVPVVSPTIPPVSTHGPTTSATAPRPPGGAEVVSVTMAPNGKSSVTIGIPSEETKPLETATSKRTPRGKKRALNE